MKNTSKNKKKHHCEDSSSEEISIWTYTIKDCFIPFAMTKVIFRTAIKHKWNTLFFFLSLFSFSCNNPSEEVKDKQTVSEKTTRKIAVPEFNSDSAYQFVKQQVDFGPRVPGTKAHAACADFMVQKLKSYNLEVTVQNGYVTTFDTKKFNLKNIIASLKPELNNRVLLCAHWDTRPFADRDTKDQNKPIDGANDGASGAGVLLEIARQLSLSQPMIGIDIILFDIEDYGQPSESEFPRQEKSWCLGSQYWGANLHKPGYTANYGILLDMVGAKDATFVMEGGSEYYAPWVLKKVWSAASNLGYSNYFIYAKMDAITDDHSYINALTAIPTIDIIHMNPLTHDFGTFHHTHADNMDVIDKNTLKAVGQTLMEVIYSENL